MMAEFCQAERALWIFVVLCAIATGLSVASTATLISLIRIWKRARAEESSGPTQPPMGPSVPSSHTRPIGKRWEEPPPELGGRVLH